MTATISNMHTQRFGGKLWVLDKAPGSIAEVEWAVHPGTTMRRVVKVPAGEYYVQVSAANVMDETAVVGEDDLPMIDETWKITIPTCQ